MKLSEVDVPLLDVEGYPQLRMVEPGIEGLSEIARRFRDDFDPETDPEVATKTVQWLFTTFVRDADGGEIEDVTLNTVRPSMVRALTAACNPDGVDGPLA